MIVKSVSFVFPMFNERDNIEMTISRAKKLAVELAGEYEIVIVDDASTDGSGDLVDELSKSDPTIRSIRLAKNMKFGGALNEGLKAAKCDAVIYTDSDFPAKEDDIKNAFKLLDSCDVVTAYSLVIKDSSIKRIIMSRVYNFLVRMLFGLKLHDINSGLKIYKRSALKQTGYRSRSPFIDVEVFVEAMKKGCRIRQYGLIFDLRTGGISTISRLTVVARTFLDMFSYKFIP